MDESQYLCIIVEIHGVFNINRQVAVSREVYGYYFISTIPTATNLP